MTTGKQATTYGFHIGEAHIFVTNQTGKEPDDLTLRKIAERAAESPIFWSDDRCRHWIYDFNVWGWWTEATRIDLCKNEMDLTIYEAPRYV